MHTWRAPNTKRLPAVSMTLKKLSLTPLFWVLTPFFKGHGDSRFLFAPNLHQFTTSRTSMRRRRVAQGNDKFRTFNALSASLVIFGPTHYLDETCAEIRTNTAQVKDGQNIDSLQTLITILASADSATVAGATSASSAAATSTSPEVLRGISRKKGGRSTHCMGTKAEFGNLTCLNVAVSPPRNSCCGLLLGSKQHVAPSLPNSETWLLGAHQGCQLRQN